MGKFEEMYSSKLRTADEISKLLHDGYVCASPICMGEPFGIVQAIAKRSAEGSLHDVEINGLLSMPGPDYLKPELYGKSSTHHGFLVLAAEKADRKGSLIIFQAITAIFPCFGQNAGLTYAFLRFPLWISMDIFPWGRMHV